MFLKFMFLICGTLLYSVFEGLRYGSKQKSVAFNGLRFSNLMTSQHKN